MFISAILLAWEEAHLWVTRASGEPAPARSLRSQVTRACDPKVSLLAGLYFAHGSNRNLCVFDHAQNSKTSVVAIPLKIILLILGSI